MIPKHCLNPKRHAEIGDLVLGLAFTAFFAFFAAVILHG
jgi:hypothetical protein